MWVQVLCLCCGLYQQPLCAAVGANVTCGCLPWTLQRRWVGTGTGPVSRSKSTPSGTSWRSRRRTGAMAVACPGRNSRHSPPPQVPATGGLLPRLFLLLVKKITMWRLLLLLPGWGQCQCPARFLFPPPPLLQRTWDACIARAGRCACSHRVCGTALGNTCLYCMCLRVLACACVCLRVLRSVRHQPDFSSLMRGTPSTRIRQAPCHERCATMQPPSPVRHTLSPRCSDLLCRPRRDTVCRGCFLLALFPPCPSELS